MKYTVNSHLRVKPNHFRLDTGPLQFSQDSKLEITALETIWWHWTCRKKYIKKRDKIIKG